MNSAKPQTILTVASLSFLRNCGTLPRNSEVPFLLHTYPLNVDNHLSSSVLETVSLHDAKLAIPTKFQKIN